MKVAGFQMRVIVKLVKEYDGYLGASVPSLTELVLQILRSENSSGGKHWGIILIFFT